MPAAVTHVIGSIVPIDLFRKYVLKKKQFPLYLVLIGGIAGLLPDIDVLVFWIIGSFTSLTLQDVHRNFTHTFFIPLLFLVIALVIWKWRQTWAHIFFVLSAGWTLHILLDIILSFRGAPVWYPLSSIEYSLLLVPQDFLSGTFYVGLDAIVLILWLVYEYRARNIRDYL